MPIDDQTRIRHMLDAAYDARAFVQGKTREDLASDRMLTRALINCIEDIGEAAANLTPAYKERYTELPWRQIVAMRNRLIHGYFDVNLDRVWETVTNDIPVLIAALEPIIPSEDQA